MPLLIACHIYGLEKTMQAYGEAEWHPGTMRDISVSKLAAIMRRPSFGGILMHLTKGPNSFLGSDSSATFKLDKLNFFMFRHPSEIVADANEGPWTGRLLRVGEAYALDDSQVVGLSGQYYLSAHNRRLEIQEASKDVYDGDFDPSDSAGCPFRFKYMDDVGTLQPAVVLRAKEFVASALLNSAKNATETNSSLIS